MVLVLCFGVCRSHRTMLHANEAKPPATGKEGSLVSQEITIRVFQFQGSAISGRLPNKT